MSIVKAINFLSDRHHDESQRKKGKTGTRPFRMPALLGVLLCAAGLLAIPGKAFSQMFAPQKPYPAGIIDLPAPISAKKPIGSITNHPWQNVNVDGVRIRTGWTDIEVTDNVYKWGLIDDCLSNATSVGKFIGLGVNAGVKCPQWLINLGVETRVLTAPDTGTMVTPWDLVYKTKYKEFIIALGARYDSSPQLGYVVMVGFQQAAESILANVQADIDFFNASAITAGYVATGGLSAGLVAWKATAMEMVDTWMAAFPTTPLMISCNRPFAGTESSNSVTAMNDIVAWGIAKYPGRFGIMNSGLKATTATGDFQSDAIYNNRLTEPVGIQFGWYTTGTACDVARVSDCDGTSFGCLNYGAGPCLTAFNATNNSLTAGVNIGCRFVEIYEVDVKNSAYQTMLTTQRAALRAQP